MLDAVAKIRTELHKVPENCKYLCKTLDELIQREFRELWCKNWSAKKTHNDDKHQKPSENRASAEYW